MVRPAGAHRSESALRPLAAVGLAMLMAGGLGLMLGGLTPVPTIRLPGWSAHSAGDVGFTVDPDGGGWLDRSEPTRVDAEAVGMHAPLVDLGMSRGGEFEVPPLGRPHVAGWFEHGATPGEFGPTVLLGHLDTEASGPAVFYALRFLAEGDRVELAREDGIVVSYEVTRTEAYSKNALPYEEVFGIEPEPALRLITCGGRFDRESGDYAENVVVYATYAGHRDATAEDRSRPLNDRDDFGLHR
ncbi:class F sortase [Glycomyces sp. L485]|uniref:class F sortase n=1 Tax=Glycomyces sp. L485 TaxID=2909235 RepID=UPI001F4B4787|nr:class F sortase [Glycomyces sp. L485]MCH7230660.1 class F sortase [Glycomyces sp. L485]